MRSDNYLRELFAFQRFDEDAGLKEMTASVESKYGLCDHDMMLDIGDMFLAAGGAGMDTLKQTAGL